MQPLLEATMAMICTRQLQAGNSNDTIRRVAVSIGQETSTDKQHALADESKAQFFVFIASTFIHMHTVFRCRDICEHWYGNRVSLHCLHCYPMHDSARGYN